ncbi:unnamed protein product [Ilex paraguariensis]|uniref:Uncharacterized protein n=1 Tax=Ilex paraguariensis TaxID=185542 RepID=A0ABC8TDI9_9AQUA
MVDRKNIGESVAVKQIMDLGFKFFFESVPRCILELCRKFYLRLKKVDTDLMILRTTVRGKLIKGFGVVFHDANGIIDNTVPRESLFVLPSLTFVGVTSSVPVTPTLVSEPPLVSMTKPRDPVYEMESKEEQAKSEFDMDDDGYSE